MFQDDRSGMRDVCTVSKECDNGPPRRYAFHTKWGEFLDPSPRGVLALGIMGRDVFVSLPHAVVVEQLDKLHRTERPERGSYWYLHITEPEPGRFRLGLPKVG